MMKNVIVLFAIMLFAGISVPQESFAKNLNTNPETVLQDEVEYKEIESKELSDKILDSLSNAFVGYDISKAYKGTDNSYKIVLSKGQESIAAYYDINGNFVKKESLDE